MEKNIRSTPMPAANNMEAHVNNRYFGREWSGPKRVLPTRVSAITTTKRTKTPAGGRNNRPGLAATQSLDQKITSSVVLVPSMARGTRPVIKPAPVKKPGYWPGKCCGQLE